MNCRNLQANERIAEGKMTHLGFDVAVEDAVLVHVRDRLQQLVHVTLDFRRLFPHKLA